jgi:hypothetical protein|tara:strand:+ start:265 stop:645 length:381 start_codon:yes stop_codon:yes gene_type:complete
MSYEEQTIDNLLDTLTSTRGEIKALQEVEKKLKSRQRELEATLMTRLDQQGIDRVGNEVCTVSLKKEIVPTVEDWDKVQQHVRDTGQFELLQKRMSATAYRELRTMNLDVPGVKPTELTRINFRSK